MDDPPDDDPFVPLGVRMFSARSCRLSMTRDIIVTEMLLAKVDRAPRSAGCSTPMLADYSEGRVVYSQSRTKKMVNQG